MTLEQTIARTLFEHVFRKIQSDKYNWETIPQQVRDGFIEEAEVVIKEIRDYEKSIGKNLV